MQKRLKARVLEEVFLDLGSQTAEEVKERLENAPPNFRWPRAVASEDVMVESIQNLVIVEMPDLPDTTLRRL